MVMGGDSHSKGRGFESQRRILDGHFFTLICCKNCIVCLKRPKMNEKEAGVGPFKKHILKLCTSQLTPFTNNQFYQFILNRRTKEVTLLEPI